MDDTENIDVQEVIRNAEAGDADAQFTLGNLYYSGEGVKQDEVKAFHWHLKAAEGGHPMAMQTVGYCYQFGEGVKKDIAKALAWYRKGTPLWSGCRFHLALCLLNGTGMKKNPKQAARELEKASADNNTDAMVLLGQMHLGHFGIPRNLEQAFHWFQKAAELGNRDAMFQLALCYKCGNSVEVDHDMADFWLKTAAGLGEKHAKCMLYRNMALDTLFQTDL